MGKSLKVLQPSDLIGHDDGDPVTMEFFKTASKAATAEESSKSAVGNYRFNPHAPEFEYIPDATPNTTNVDYFNNLRQSSWTKAGRGLKQFGANLVSSIGQGLANTFDLVSTANTLKGEIAGTPDDFQSSLFGLTTKDMQGWASGVEERNRIFEEKPDSFDPSNFGWWTKQFASAGTGVGMAVEALGTTIGIEALTGGAGTAAALGKLGSLIKRGANIKEALDVAKGLKSAATLYGVVNRYSESRMEAQNTFDQIYNNLGEEKNSDGTPKFDETEKKYLASEGARKDFNINLALLPLDILSYRTMVFNPISGTGEGLLEKGLEKVAGIYGKSKLGKALGYATTHAIGAHIEGTEEVFQQIGQNEGEHYARVLGGLDDGSSFSQRLGADLKDDQTWNNYAGGVIGTPLIAGSMKLANKIMQGNKAARMNEIHKDYITNVGKMDSATANLIRKYESEGNVQTATTLRRQFGANKALGSLHLDAMTDKDSAFDSYLTFLKGTLDEVNSGKLDVLGDLGFHNPTEGQVAQIKQEFGQYIDDAEKMEGIYDNVKNKYNKNFVPQIAMDHFQLSAMLGEQAGIDTEINSHKTKLFQYGELTGNGKTIYDSNYQLQALQLEKVRLTTLFRNTTDTHEKANIQAILDSNQLKLTEAKQKLEEAQNDPEYNNIAKSKDNDILSSSLTSQDYIQAVYNKEHLSNEITAKRKKIALWDKPEYMENKNKEAIAKAKTSAQIEETEKDLKKNKQDTEQVQQAVENKKNEINATQAAEIVQQQRDEQENASDPFISGNANLFEDDNNLIDSLKNEINADATPVDDESQPNPNQQKYLFTPQDYDFNKSSDESKNRVINGVRGLLDRLGDKNSFEDLVRHVVKVQGANVADDIFNALKFGWEGNGFAKVDYQAVYDKVFGNPMEELMGGVSELSRGEEKVKEANNDEVEKILDKDTAPEFDINNQPVHKYKGYVTNESSPKMAYTTRLSEATLEKDEEGAIIVSREYTTEELNTGEYVDATQLLDPDKFQAGEELNIRIPANFNDIKIPIFKTDGTKGQSMTFGEFVAKNKLSPSDQEYQDKIPMIHYTDGVEKGLSFVHDIGWYNPVNFNIQFKGDMEKAIANTREVRKAVLDNKGNNTSVTITGKRQTTFAGLKTKENISLREANPQTQLTVALTTDSLSTSKKNTVFPNNDTKLQRNSPFKIGAIYDVRRYGLDAGVKTYQALEVIKPKLDEISRSSILQSIFIYASRNNKDANVRKKHDDAHKQILDIMGLDIYDPRGLESYLQHFITTFNTDKAYKNEDVEAQARSKYPVGTPYIAFIAGGNLVFGRTGEAAFTTNAGVKKYSFFINPNAINTNPSSTIKNLERPIMLGWYEQNINLDNLNRNKPVITIDKSFNVAQSAPTYNDFLLDRLQTNIKSVNIGTKENPNYVTNIQPVITYELTSKLSQGLEQAKEVVDRKGRKEISKTTEEGRNETLADRTQRIIEQAKRDLGSDFGKSKDGSIILAPKTLEKDQREAVAESINRIAGLTPDQQFDITDFMYNQITATVNLENKVATRAETDKVVKDAFDKVIKPLKDYTKDKITELNQLIKDHPEFKDSGIPDIINEYKARLAKIKSIEDNFDILKEEAYNRVAKYTGITEERVKNEDDTEVTEENDDENRYYEDEKNDKERDFWTDVLQESPEDKLTYSMRRFFGQIRKVDKNGESQNGFLGLPTYIGADQIIRKLMVTLADTPSDFQTMLAKLESIKESVPWMQEVINKLNGTTHQKGNQFVTVMSNTSLRMKFTMISFNRKTNSWTTRVFDTALNGIADSVRKRWSSNFNDSQLAIADEEGNYQLNKVRAQVLMNTFENWKGISLKEVNVPESNWNNIVSRVKPNSPIVFTATGELLFSLQSNLPKDTDRVRFNMKGKEFQINKADSGNYRISYLNKNSANKAEIDAWLKEFGINLSNQTLDELETKGLYHNYKQRTRNDLFTSGDGLYQILYNSLKKLVEKPGDHTFEEYGDSPLDNTVITSLANLESKYNNEETPFGFRDNGKSYFALTAPKFVTDRARDLKLADSVVRQQLLSTSFSNQSLWLRLLSDDKFRNLFTVSHIGANAFKELGKKLYRDNAITKLSDADHELTKLGMFWDTTQGEVSYLGKNKEGKDTEFKEYPDTGIGLRMGTMLSPTMSDKHLITLVTTAILNLQNKDLLNGKGISDEVVKIIYEQTVKPELQRMIKFWQNGGNTNINGYAKGASLFLMMPEMNGIEYTQGLKLIDAIKHKPHDFTLQFVEGNSDLREAINSNIKAYVTKLVDDKLEVWKKNGLVDKNSKDETILTHFDKKYIDKFRGTADEKATMAATDFVVNSLIANANNFMAFAGDPALYFKSKDKDYLQIAKDTWTNAGKRLANQIAPGTALSNSEGERYLQVFIKDRESIAENIEYLEKILGKEGAAPYRKIEASDAQEYTTWKEHLDILDKLGKTPDTLSDITADDIQQARELMTSGVKLDDKQMQLIGKVMQPIKPVYTGQIYDPSQDVMRTVYIKSSSFPLIPQFTAGMEIDKLRLAMEKLQDSRKMNVRGSYQSANKVGALAIADEEKYKLWNKEGNINQELLDNIGDYTLILDRKNFRIQQEVPFKSSKNKQDLITLGTQITKLLFGDEMMNFTGFNYNGQKYSGKYLYQIYNDSFIKLTEEKKNQLYSELGLDNNGVPVDVNKSIAKLQEILKNEATKRGYPLQDIQSLKINKDREFTLPLWASSNSNRYESMMNSIVSNRIIRMKFPGSSYVVGSEEGFRISDNIEDQDKSKIIFTSSWNGKELQGTKTSNNELKYAQVLVASKFRDAEGNLIDLFEVSGKDYKYITKTEKGFNLKEDMFSKELLNMPSFRIPTSGHQSASQIEIVGFLPYQSGDLMIVPKGFTKQKGLDFDIDKENTYKLWSHFTKDGKLEILEERHRNQILSDADSLLKTEGAGKFLQTMFGDTVGIEYSKEDLEDNKYLAKLNSQITEKLLQNEIIKITSAVLSNPKDEVQAKINKVLSTEYAEDQANYIEKLTNLNKNEKFWTPLSDEYQKQKLMMGASGKIGTGAYSLDVVFHSLANQANINGKPIILTEMIEDAEGEPITRDKEYRFGTIKSDGVLGRATTLDGNRSVAEVVSERQNIAVDNEKLQVMGRVNLNDLTMDVDKVFNLLGFDKGKDGNSISFLFLSQPIIKEYIQRMKNANSNMAKFALDKEGTIVRSLLEEYDAENQAEIDDEYWEKMSSLMTNENLASSIRAEKPLGSLQGAVLRRFIEMKKYGLALRNIQTTINTDSKGLGKSFFDVVEKRNAINRLGADSALVSGASHLIGDFEPKNDLTQEEIDEMKDYVDMGAFMIRPTTLSGAFNINGVSTAYNLWSKFFPYDSSVINKAFSEVMSITAREDISDTNIIEKKQEIFKGMKRYFAASTMNGIINPYNPYQDSINAERARLYIDSDTNTSLAKYLSTISQMTGNDMVNTYIKTNKLLNSFEFDINKNGKPSLIKYNNAAGEEFDEQYLYESLSTLMENRGSGSVELPSVGNKSYTLDTLAQDLIAYAYLGNSIQEAIQFTKYIPIEYLNQVGYSERMRLANKWLDTNPDLLGIKIGNKDTEKHLVSEFTMQYIQHNPESVMYKRDMQWLNTQTIKAGDNAFHMKSEDRPIFISVYDSYIPKGEKKFRLYWFDGSKYTRVPVLGTFGMDEYQPRNEIGVSLVNGKQKIKIAPQGEINSHDNVIPQEGVFKINTGTIYEVVQSIADSNTTPYTDLAKHLLPYIGDIGLIVADKIEQEDGNVYEKFSGVYNKETGNITINPSIISDPNKLAETIHHELVHALTIREVDKWLVDGETGDVQVKPDAPTYVTSLVRLYNAARNNNKGDLFKIAAVHKDVQAGKAITTEQLEKYYGFTNIYEFMSMALTSQGFQQILNKIPYKNTGESFLDRFKKIIIDVLKAIGVKFDENFTAAHAISNIFELIDKSNTKTEFNPYETFYDDIQNDNNDEFGLNDLSDDTSTPPIIMSPTERDYINSNTGINTHSNINFFPADNDAGVYMKFIQFKESQLSILQARLGKVESDKKKKDISVEQLNKLNKQSRDLKQQIEGSFERGIKGLKQEIVDLKKNAELDAVGYYIEKDLARLERLTNSTDVDDIREAQRIVDFYTLAGTFRVGIENPFFSQEDIFLEDENGNITSDYRLADEIMNKFIDWKERATRYTNIIDKKNEEITVNTVNSNNTIKNTYGKDKKFTIGELTHDSLGLKDADWVSMWTMDITQGIFSHNGVIPQVMFSYLVNSFEKKLHWARDVEEKIDKLNPEVIKELKKLNQTYKDRGIVGIEGTSYEIFKEKTKDGNETGGIIQRFNKEYFDEERRMLSEFNKAFAIANIEEEYTRKVGRFNKAFEDLKRWRRNNTIIVDIDNIPELRSNPDFKELFSGRPAPTDIHKEYLIKTLGQKGYAEAVEEQTSKLKEYIAGRQAIMESLFVDEQKFTYDELSPKAKSIFEQWIVNRSPLKGIEDYNTVQGLFHGDRKANNFMGYNHFIPRKYNPIITVEQSSGKYVFSDSSTPSSHYNSTFGIIEDNATLNKFYDVIREVCDNIRESMPPELQQKMSVNTLPALLKTSSEIINDKNSGILSSVIAAFRNLMERIRLGFGVVKQSEISYAIVDPITGKANYKVNDQFLQGNTKAISERMIIEKTKFLHSFNIGIEKVDKINRFSILNIKRFSPQSLILLSQYLNVDISLADINAGRIDKIKARTGENVEIGKIIRDFSLHSVVQSQSFDLAKIAKYYSNMAMAYAARQEALPILEIMKKHYEQIQKPHTNNLGNGIYNARNEEYMKGGVRTNAIKQMDDWFERVVLDNYGTKHLGPHGDTKAGKKKVAGWDNRIAEINKILQDNPKASNADKLIVERERLLVKKQIPVWYYSNIYSKEDRKKIGEISTLLQTEKDEKKRAELIKIKEGTGKLRTATAFFDNIWSWIRTLRLGYNISSASTNFLEGVTSNMILGASNEYFDPKEMFYGYNVVKHSFIKNLTFGKAETGLAKKNRSLMDKFNVIMDSKNELQKSSIKTMGDRYKLSALNPHALNQRVEYINQSPIMIAMLRTLKLKGKDGTESSIWDAYENTGHLKSNFKTEENIKNWEELKGDDYLTFKQKLHKVIVLGHGNYDELRGMMIKSSTVGKAAMMFKTWLPMQFYWRFATEQDDIQSGTIGYKGRYWSYGAGTAATHLGIVGAAAFGFTGLGLGVLAGAAIGKYFGTKVEGVSFLKESIEATKSLVRKAFGLPVNLIAGKQLINTTGKSFDDWVGKGDFTAQDAKNLKANMADLTMQLAWLALILLVKAMFWDDKDKPEDTERIAHNILINKLMQLSSQAAQYVSPVDTYKSVFGSNAVNQYLTDLAKEAVRVENYLEGRDIIQSGINAGESGLGNQTKKILLPGIFKDKFGGFETQAERVFLESPWHPFFKGKETKEKEANKRDRAERRLELEAQELTPKEIRHILDTELPTPSKLKKLDLTREEYEQSKSNQ